MSFFADQNSIITSEIMEKLNSIHDKLDKADARYDADSKRAAYLIESIMELNATIIPKIKS